MLASLGRKRANPVTEEVQEELLFRGLKRGKDNVSDTTNSVRCVSCNTSLALKELGLTRFPVQWSWQCNTCTKKSRGAYMPFPLASSASVEE